MLLSINDLQKIDTLVLILGFPVHSVNLCSAPIDDGTPYISFEMESIIISVPREM